MFVKQSALINRPVELAQSLFVVPVPNVYIAIASTSGKGIVVLMEADGVHWVNIFNSVFLHPVAFESIFLLLSLSTWVKVFNSHPAFYRADNIARLVWEASQAPGLNGRTKSNSHQAYSGQDLVL